MTTTLPVKTPPPTPKKITHYLRESQFLFRQASGSYSRGSFFYDFFLAIGAEYEDLKMLFQRHPATLKYIDDNCVEIFLKEDTWRIRKNGAVPMLYHNDYTVGDDYRRTFNGTFHRQVLNNGNTFHDFARYICGYSWRQHIGYLSANRIIEDKNRLRLSLVENYQQLPGSGLLFNAYLFVDTNNTAMNLFSKSFLFLPRVIVSQVGTTDYSLIYCLVPKIFNRLFLRLMDDLKKLCIQEKRFSYTNICENNILQDKPTSGKPYTVSSNSELLAVIPPKMILKGLVSIQCRA